ncbi:peptidase domain-containing ABC transporter [Pantoea stewartii]|uniref:peptidase domain-containing ABC transporter n=1 Tax=Pantoea stewartii TaxID=66269 RepID=UPI001982457A|nr:peptidase domain-containing ABC transporter [Pantoea stewartii]
MMENKLEVILSKLGFRFFSGIPVIHQAESSECGIASLAMVCSHFGKNISMLDLRRRFHPSTRGATLAHIKQVAQQLGLNSRALSLDIDELTQLKTPCILHWNFNHFVVLVKVRKNQLIIHDPARGRVTLTYGEVSKFFTGVALELWPGNTFAQVKKIKKIDLTVFISGVEGIKKAIIKIFCLSLVIEAITLLLPIGTQIVLDHVIPSFDSGLLELICLSLFLLILLRTTLGMIRTWSSLVMSTLIEIQWKSGLFAHLLNLPLAFFERRRLGDIQSRFNSLDDLRNNFTTNVVGAIMDLILVLGVSGMLWLYGGTLFFLVAGFSLVYIVIRVSSYNYYRQLSEETMVSQARVNSYFVETLYGIVTVKTQDMVDNRTNSLTNLLIEKVNTGIKLKKMDMLFSGINTFVSTCEQVIILWLGASMVLDNKLTIGMFIAFSSFREQFSDRIASLINALLQLKMMSLHNERISDIALNEVEAKKKDFDYNTQMQPLSLVATDISYRYDAFSKFLFENVHLSIREGECIAIIGPSGSGKTTFLKILMGLFSPTEGVVKINGNDIAAIGVNNYRKMVACVMQEDKIFAGTIRENICGFAEENDSEWMERCAQISYIHDDIMALPMGYETLLGELGEGMSGGQKQRIFIARAIYRKPGILFMDEATSHLDSDCEALVSNAIKKMKITRVIVAHRETTISSADRVVDLSML